MMNEWIPVSEKLPKFDEKEAEFPSVLVTDGIGVYIAYYTYDCVIYEEPQNGTWYDATDNDRMSGILAWMPLPEPYRPEERA